MPWAWKRSVLTFALAGVVALGEAPVLLSAMLGTCVTPLTTPLHLVMTDSLKAAVYFIMAVGGLAYLFSNFTVLLLGPYLGLLLTAGLYYGASHV